MNWMRVLAIWCVVLPLVLVSSNVNAQSRNTSAWERIGSIDFGGLARQGERTVVATTSHGYMYISHDWGSSWKHQKIDDTLALGKIVFLDSLHGAVIASRYYPATYLLRYTLLVTSDGGATWQYRPLPTDTVTSRASNAHVSGLAYPAPGEFLLCDEGGFVWRSTDDGRTWQVNHVAFQPLNAVTYLKPSIALMVGAGGWVGRTDDDGLTWTRVEVGAGDSIDCFNLDFRTPDLGAVFGFGYIYITTDGGASWRAKADYGHNRQYTGQWINDHQLYSLGPSGQCDFLPSLDGSLAVSLLDSVIFVDFATSLWSDRDGAIALGFHGGLIVRSVDGRAWKPVSQYGVSSHLLTVINGAYYSIADANFARSTDSGESWTVIPFGQYFNGSGSYAALHFSDSLHGLALSSAHLGATLETTDAGLSWHNAGLNADMSGASIGEFSGNVAYLSLPPSWSSPAWYSEEALYRTNDAGVTWTKAALPDTSGLGSPFSDAPLGRIDLNPPFPVDASHAYMLLSAVDTVKGRWFGRTRLHSFLQFTSDGGSSWRRINSYPETPNASSIFFLDVDHGFIGCDSGVVYSTEDAGATWQRVKLPLSSGPHYVESIAFRNPSIGFAGTNDSLTLLVTEDGGRSWQDAGLKSGAATTRILFPNPSTTLVCSGGAWYRQSLTAQQDVHLEGGSNIFFYARAYPLPASDVLNVQLDGMFTTPDGRVRAGLYDLLGRKVLDLSQAANAGNNGVTSKFSVNLGSLANGPYSLHYELGSWGYTIGIIVLH